MSEAITVGKHYIQKNPDVLGGEPHIADKRISVSFIVELYVHQNTPVEEIVAAFPVTSSETYAALAYYYDHTDEIDGLLDEWDKAATKHDDPERKAQLLARAQAKGIELAQEQEMTASEISEEFGITSRVVRLTATKGWIPARKSGATWLIRRSDAEARWGDRVRRAG
ncbi:MAG: DUF433 domain-containing protein [Anaerolineae bacterium]|nr:DUF433 domain-containing protein [Anaerolineae bacterium]